MNTSRRPAGIVAAAEIGIGSGRSRRFVGAEHRADISYFYVENQPGEGPGMLRILCIHASPTIIQTFLAED